MPLTPSQRVTLIKGVADALQSEEWPLVDLCLKQFSLPWTDQWSGNKYEYILEMLTDAPDGGLLDLADHLGFHLNEIKPSGIEPPFWRKGMFRLFITHLAKYRKFAGELQDALRRFGISCFVAHNDIEPTLEWQNEIEAALGTCEALVALLHPEFHLSNWTDQEVGFAMGRGVPVFTVRLGEDPYGFIGRFQAFNGNGKSAPMLARELFDTLRQHKQTQRRMGEVLIGLFEDSDSYAEAKERIQYLEEMTTWEPSFPDRIESAAETNSQISGAYGVPYRVDALAKKWGKTGT